VEHHLRETRGGELYRNDFGRRMTGEGKMAAMIGDLFRLHARKNGLNESERGRQTRPGGAAGDDATIQKIPSPRERNSRPEKPQIQTDLFTVT
jgi:hypothetical protein